MLFKKTFFLNLALAALCASISLILSSQGLLKRAELASLDFCFRLRGPAPANTRINIIEITDSDITKIGRWPWPRQWHAAITEALTAFGAKAIYFDIIFAENSDEKDDAIFEEAIKKSKNVYLPFVFHNNIIDKSNLLLPIKKFYPYIKGTGAVNIYPDSDGILRRIPIAFRDKEGQIYPHAALSLALDYRGLKVKELNPRWLLVSGANEEFRIPIADKNTMLINWAGKWEYSFNHYDYLGVLAAYQDMLENKKVNINTENFKNSICLVGLTAIGLYDIKPIPLQPEYPGIGIVANAVNNIIDKKYLFDVPQWIGVLLMIILSLIPAFFIRGERPLKDATFVLLIGLLYFLVNFLLFENHINLELYSPLFALVLSSFSIGTYNFVRVSVERQNFFKMSVTDGLTGLYNIRYFKILLETEIMMAKVDREKKFSIIMSDVDHFKHFNDTYGHQVGDIVLKEVAAAIKNSVRSSDIVARYGGEEMIVLLRGSSSLEDAANVAEKIRRNIENAVVKDQNNSYKVTASLGVSFIKPSDTVDSIIKRADDGLYKAKTLGRNRVCSMKDDLKTIPPNQQQKN